MKKYYTHYRKNRKGQLTSVLVRVKAGRDGELISRTMQVDKAWGKRELEKRVDDFANQLIGKYGNVNIDKANMTFVDYAEEVIETKLIMDNLEISTATRYRSFLPAIYEFFGDTKLIDVDSDILDDFYLTLIDTDNKNFSLSPRTIFKEVLDNRILGRCAHPDLKALVSSNKRISIASISRASGVPATTVSAMVNGRNVKEEGAVAVATALGYKVEELFNYPDKRKKLSNKTVIEYHRFISSVLSYAVSKKILKINEAEYATTPKAEKPEINYYTTAELELIKTAMDEEPIYWRTLGYMLISTGARRGEILGMRWRDINMDTGVLYIHNNIVYRKGYGIYETTPKTAAGKRFISLPSKMLSLLKEHRAQQLLTSSHTANWDDNDYIFPNRYGRAKHPDSVNKWLKRLQDKHDNLPELNPHAFRHTAASILLLNNIDLASIAHQLGHANISTTLNIYAHVITDALVKNAAVLDKYI